MPTSENANEERWLTTPNLLTLVRIFGSPALIWMASFDNATPLMLLAGCLVLTEWLDGFLARQLRVTSAIGARLDTVADAVFYTCLLVALSILRWEVIAGETVWILSAVGSYALSWLASLLKFRRLPSYHTWAAKGVWLLVGVGIVCLLFDWTLLPLRIALVCVTCTNLEAIAITYVLSECKTDVPSLWHALRLEDDGEAEEVPPSEDN